MSGFEVRLLGDRLQPRLDPAGQRVGAGGEGGVEASGFGSALADAIQHVDTLTRRSGEQVGDLATGKPVALHDIMMSMGKSEVAFNLMLEVRNKLVDAWEKLSRSVV